MSFRTDEGGDATATMGMLEPYCFKIKAAGKAEEYMPQQFVFQTSRRCVTAVVARAILGPIKENRVLIALDTSGSMQVYVEDVKTALNCALAQQFWGSTKHFNILTYTESQTLFRPGLVDCSAENIEDAMRFVDCIEAGGGSDILSAADRSFGIPGVEAIYFITDGKCDVGDPLLARVRQLYFGASHGSRPKLHAVGINCVPKRLTWRGLQAAAQLTQGVFRPVCLEQERPEPAKPGSLSVASGRGLGDLSIAGIDLALAEGSGAAPGATTDEDLGYTEPEDDTDDQGYASV